MSTTPNPNLQALTDAGVAVWLDSLKRSYLTGGTLEAWRDEYVLHGVTTNPAIFGEAFATGRVRRSDRRARSGRP